MRVTCIVYFLLLPLWMTAQTREIDSLHSLAQTATGIPQIELYKQAALVSRNVDADTAMYFAGKTIQLAEQSGGDYEKMIAYSVMGRTLNVKGSYDLSIKYLKEALRLSQQQKNDSITASSHNGIGSSLWQLGKHAEAIENHFKALRIWERIQHVKGIATSNVLIGMVYQTQEKLPLAEKYVRTAVELLKKNYDPGMQISSMHTLANIYGMQGKIKEAFAIDEEGIAIAERTNNQLAKSLFLDNMGNCYLYGDPPDYTKAIEYFLKTLQIDSSFGNKKQMSDSYVNLGDAFFQQKKYEEAIPYLQRSILLADESGYAQGKLKALLMLSTAYRQSRQADNSYMALQRAMKVKDSLVNTTSEARIAELETVYETEKKQQQINLQQEQLSKKNYILGGIILLTLLLALLGLSAWRRFRLNQKSRFQQEFIKQQELAARAVIKAEEDERQRIARDLHDGVGQMMSAAKMNLSAFESTLNLTTQEQQESFEKIIGLVDESCKEIRSVSHNMMPNALLKNNLAIAIRDFTDKIEKNGLEIRLYTEGLDQRLDANVETVLYRVIQECVNNVIKHAKATSLDISVIKDKEGISATIEDNGKGFDRSDKEKTDGIGLKNILTRVEYLKGAVDIDSAPGRGTVIALNVPLNNSPKNNIA